MKRILVTGATGLLGSNLVRHLLLLGHGVSVLIHKNSGKRTLTGLPLRRVQGDLLVPNSLGKAIQDCDALIHTAAHTDVWPSRDPTHQSVNVQGTLNLIDCALQHDVKKFIHVGSANSFLPGSKSQPGNEEQSWESNPYQLDYIDSKAEAQRRVLQAVYNRKLPGVVVNPTFMIGPYDSKPSSGAMLLALAKGKLPGYTQGGKNWVYVGDVVVGISQALKLGKPGQCYLLGHENLSYNEALTRMAQAIGTPPPELKIPSAALKAFGRAGSIWGKMTGRTPPISYPMARLACEGHYYSPKKAIQELDLPQTPIEVAAEEAFKWFSDNGYV